LEKANGILSHEATQFWKEGLDNKAAREAHECKIAAEVKEVTEKSTGWMQTEKGVKLNLLDSREFREKQFSKLKSVMVLP
jgi:hypothetical protein